MVRFSCMTASCAWSVKTVATPAGATVSLISQTFCCYLQARTPNNFAEQQPLWFYSRHRQEFLFVTYHTMCIASLYVTSTSWFSCTYMYEYHVLMWLSFRHLSRRWKLLINPKIVALAEKIACMWIKLSVDYQTTTTATTSPRQNCLYMGL